jgi:hypothetical protein
MTRLIQALLALNLYGEIDLAGRWVKLQGEQCVVSVVEAAWGDGYVTWYEDGKARVVVGSHARSIPNVRTHDGSVIHDERLLGETVPGMLPRAHVPFGHHRHLLR